MKKVETPQLRLQDGSSTQEPHRQERRTIIAAGIVDHTVKQNHVTSDEKRPMGFEPILGHGLQTPGRDPLSIIVKLLLVLIITASASSSVMACPGGYYQCGTNLCCPK